MGIPANQAAPASGGEAGPPRQGAPGRGPQQTWLPRKVAPGKMLVARLSWDGTSSGKPALTLNCIRLPALVLPHPLGPSVMVLIAHFLDCLLLSFPEKVGHSWREEACQILGNQKGPAELASVSEGMNEWSRPWGWVSAGNTPVFLLFVPDI